MRIQTYPWFMHLCWCHSLELHAFKCLLTTQNVTCLQGKTPLMTLRMLVTVKVLEPCWMIYILETLIHQPSLPRFRTLLQHNLKIIRTRHHHRHHHRQTSWPRCSSFYFPCLSWVLRLVFVSTTPNQHSHWKCMSIWILFNPYFQIQLVLFYGTTII